MVTAGDGGSASQQRALKKSRRPLSSECPYSSVIDVLAVRFSG